MIDIQCGDCILGMKALPEGSVSVVVTSPPYNLGIKYGAHFDLMTGFAYRRWCEEWILGICRVLEPSGSFFLNLGSKPSDPMGLMKGWRAANDYFITQNVIHWIKSIHVDGHTHGHVKPVNSERFLNDAHEYIFHLTKTGDVPLDRLAVGVPYADKTNLVRGNRGKNGDVRCAGNCWHIPYDTIQVRSQDRPHPAAFPVSLAERCIRLHGLGRTRRVLDPFNGIGSTMMACKNLGLDGIGFDIDPDYCNYARERCSNG